MSVSCSCGTTFHLRGHLWVVVFELPGLPRRIVAVSLTTKREGSDTTVILGPNDHKFIVRPTVVSFADARIFDKDDLVDRIKKKFFGINDPFEDDMIKQLQNGLISSPFTPGGLKELCRKIFEGEQNSTGPKSDDASSADN